MRSVEELKDLTIELDATLIQSVDEKVADVFYDVEGGECYGFSLFNNGKIAVQRAFLSKGAEFPMHIHDDEKEHLIFYEGKGKAIVEGQEDRILEEGDCILIPAGVSHGWKILEDSWVIGITVPAEEAYP